MRTFSLPANYNEAYSWRTGTPDKRMTALKNDSNAENLRRTNPATYIKRVAQEINYLDPMVEVLFLRTYKMLNMFDLISDFRKAEKQNNEPMNTFSPIRQAVSQSYNFSNPQQANTQQQNYNTVFSPPKISFYIAGQEVNKNVFRTQLLITKQAKRTWFMSDGRQKDEIWDASDFTETSSLMGNIQSTSTWRKWKQLGIIGGRFDVD